LLNQAVDDGVTSIQNAKKGLENYRTLILSVQRQVESGEKEKTRLEARIQSAIDSDDPNHTADEYAMVLADVEQHLDANREQLAKHKETYDNFAKQVELGQAKVAEARLKATRLGLELEHSKREKEMAKFARDFSFDPNGLNTGLARAEELINQKIDANRAVGDVAADMAKQVLAEAADDESERKAAAAKILERFKKQSTT
jgi:phage shock protein A